MKTFFTFYLIAFLMLVTLGCNAEKKITHADTSHPTVITDTAAQEKAVPEIKAKESAEEDADIQQPSDKNDRAVTETDASATESKDFDPNASSENLGIDPNFDMQAALEEDKKFVEDIPLGDLIGEDKEKLKPLDPNMPVWIDMENKKVVFQGLVCTRKYPLEFIICEGNGVLRTTPYEDEKGMPEKIMQFLGDKTHETLICAPVRPSILHAGLLAIGARVGHPVIFDPEFIPADGDEVTIIFRWKDTAGKVQEVPWQYWVRDHFKNEQLDAPLVFAGSIIYEDTDGNRRYAADSYGEIAGIANFSSSMLDIPQLSSNTGEERLIEAYEERIPDRGTPVTILFGVKKRDIKPLPVLEKKASAESPEESVPQTLK